MNLGGPPGHLYVAPVSTPDLSLIDQAFAHGMVQVRDEIEAFVEFLRPRQIKNVLEIGSESGGTFYLWCRLAKVGGLKISLDLPTGASGSCAYADPEKLAGRTAKFKSWAPRVKVVTGDSHEETIWREVSDILNGEQLDLLFIDGDHSCEGVQNDFEMYAPFVRPGGLIAFHDIKDSEYHRLRSCYVAHLWEELRKLPRSWEFLSRENDHCGGIGVVEV